jgi:hypothetical protein
MECDHKSKVLEWGYELKDGQMKQYVSLYGCTECDATSPEPFPSKEEVFIIDHSNCDSDPCFGCKAKGLQLSTGDANSQSFMSKKKYNKEMDAYKEARRQGIQPGGTTMQKIEAAHKASEALGKPYNGNSMISAEKITTKTAQVMKEIGQI